MLLPSGGGGGGGGISPPQQAWGEFSFKASGLQDCNPTMWKTTMPIKNICFIL